jgi:50S ribosomal subunit-associated GTPase HflX
MPQYPFSTFAPFKERVEGSRGTKKRPTALFFSHNSLTGAQSQFLESEFGLPVFDRFSVVLQIFRLHAKTREAKLQVSLAEIPMLR